MKRLYGSLLPIFLLPVLILFQSCGNNEDIAVSKNPELPGLIAPIVLEPDSTILELSDYFRHPKAIDSIFLNKNLTYKFSSDSSKLVLTVKDKSLPRVSVMTVYADGYPYSVILTKSPKIWYHFVFDPGFNDYKKVEITGEMNEWTTGRNTLRLKDRKWQTDILLNPGKYEYQLIIDGKRMPDPGNPDKNEGYSGGWNSVLRAGTLTAAGAPYLYTLKQEKGKITIGVKNNPSEILVLWDNHQLDSTFWKPDSAGISITIPKKAKDFERSFIRVIACNGIGISNMVLIPVNDGRVITDPSDLTRHDKEAMIGYYIITDRFMNGNPNNDLPVKDSTVDKRLNFQGGDFSGILKKIEEGYFKKLGVNTLIISPVNENPTGAWPDFFQGTRRSAGYDGQWPVSLSATDKRFGSPDELKSVTEEAHSNDLNVMLDLIANRIHKESYIFSQHPEWITPLLPQDDGKKNIRLWQENPYSTWWEDFMPTLDLENPDVCAMLSDSAIYWIKAFELDGFRFDAMNHVPDNYLRILARKMKENVVIPDKRPVVIAGDASSGNRADLMTRSKAAGYLNPGKTDAVCDVNLYLDAVKTFSRYNASFRDLSYSLRESMNYFGDHSLVCNISGGPLLPRFISYASGDLTASDDFTKAGWIRNIKVSDTSAYSKMAMLQAFNMTIPGIPVIYYGDEIGMPGAGDPDNRRMMRFDSLSNYEAKLLGTVGKLATLRKNSIALIYGDLKVIEVSDRIFVYMRSYFDKVAIIILNRNLSNENVSFELPERFKASGLRAGFGNKFEVKNNKVNVSLKGTSFEVLTN